MVKYNIISTGSDGNATILEDFVLVYSDARPCGQGERA